MLTLRFQRVGKKHDTIFRVVAVDSRFSSKSGKVKEVLGWWDPRQDKFELKTERINYWLKNGAQTSDSCFNLLVKAKIIEGPKKQIVFHKKKSKEQAPTSAKAMAGKETKPQETRSETKPEEAPAEPTPIEPAQEPVESKPELISEEKPTN